MGDYSVPENIRALKPKGTIIKKIKGNYYVYSHSQVKDEKTNKWKTTPGKLLGKIVPNVGFCPKESKIDSVDSITCFDYGEYLLTCGIAKTEYDLLTKIFNPDEAMTLFYMASFYAINGFIGLKALDLNYDRSLIHRDYPCLKFSYHLVSKLLELIGRTNKQNEYQKIAIDSSSNTIAFDGHVIPTFSDNNDLASLGFKSKVNKSTYMNLMVALDIKTLEPIATQVFPGYSLDKTNFIPFCDTIGNISDKIILIDMGFFSLDNLKYIEEKKGYYVIPVSENRIEYKEISKNKRGRLAQFLYHKNNKIDTVEYKEKTIDGRKIIYYKNISEAEKLSSLYLLNLENCKPGYSMEEYNNQYESFGVIVLETNLDKTPKEIYELYKSRWSIESYYDRLKNGIHFESLNLDDYAVTQGLAFVMMIAGRIDAKIYDAAKKVKLTRKELIQLMKYLKLYDDGKNNIKVLNVKKQHQQVLSNLNILLDATKKCLS